MQILGREQYILSKFVSANAITDKTSSIFSALLKLYNASPRYHTMLDEPVVSYFDFSTDEGLSVVKQLSYIQNSPAVASMVVNTTIIAIPYTLASERYVLIFFCFDSNK